MPMQTSRLNLGPIDETNRIGLRQLLTNTQIMQFDFDGPLDESEAEELIHDWESFYAKNGFGRLSIHLKDGRFIGYCGVSRSDLDSHTEYELDFRLLPEFWGKGYATEAAKVYCQELRKNYGIDSVVAAIKPYNSKTIHVAHKLGMQFEKEVKISGRRSHLYRFNLND